MAKKNDKKSASDYSEKQAKLDAEKNANPAAPSEESAEDFYEGYEDVESESNAPVEVDAVAIPSDIAAKIDVAQKNVRLFLKFNRRGESFILYGIEFLPAEKVDKEGKTVKATPMFNAMLAKGGKAFPAKGVVFQALKTGIDNECKRLGKSLKDSVFHVTYIGEQESNQKIAGRKGIFKSFVVRGY